MVLPTSVLIIPPNYNVTGTCGECGGVVVQPMAWAGSGPTMEWCINCGRKVKPTFVEVRKMEY